MKEPDEITPIEFTTNTRQCVLGILLWMGLLIYGTFLIANAFLTPRVRSIMFLDILFSLIAIMFLLIIARHIYGYTQALNARPKMLLNTNGITHTWITPSPTAWHLVREAEIYYQTSTAWGVSLVLYRDHPPLTAESSIVKIRHNSLLHDDCIVTIPTFMFPAGPQDIIKEVKDRMALAKKRSV